MNTDRARELVEQIAASVEEIGERLAELWRGQGWIALGYSTWSELCEVEFGSVAVGRLLPREERRGLATRLEDEGMSSSAIGAGLGVPARTIRKDLATRQKDRVGNVIGLDGRTYDTETMRAAQRASAEHAARKDAERRAADEIARGIYDTNLHIAESVRYLAIDPSQFLRHDFPHHGDLVEPMRLTRARVTAARAFLDALLERGDLS